MKLRVEYTLCLILLAGCAENASQPGTPAAGEPAPSNDYTSGAPAAGTAEPAIAEGAAQEVAAAQAAGADVKILSHEEIQKLIAAHKGKVVVMDCWSTSCEPCVKEFPHLVALHKKYGPDKVACISLSFDYEGIGKPEDVLPVVKDFVQKQGATFDNVLCREDSETLYKKMNLASVPAVYVYKPDGELAKRFDNEEADKPEDAFSYEHVTKLVEQLVAAK